MKENLFNRLKELKSAINGLGTDDKGDAKGILAEAAEVVHQFNRGKYQHGPEELDLNQKQLAELIRMIDEIWKIAEGKDLEVWPKPEIDMRKGD